MYLPNIKVKQFKWFNLDNKLCTHLAHHIYSIIFNSSINIHFADGITINIYSGDFIKIAQNESTTPAPCLLTNFAEPNMAYPSL